VEKKYIQRAKQRARLNRIHRSFWSLFFWVYPYLVEDSFSSPQHHRHRLLKQTVQETFFAASRQCVWQPLFSFSLSSRKAGDEPQGQTSPGVGVSNRQHLGLSCFSAFSPRHLHPTNSTALTLCFAAWLPGLPGHRSTREEPSRL
jgi:hypothetical protein